MKKIDLSAISTNVGLPVKSGTLQHLQDAYKEIVDAVAKALIGEAYDPAEFYILFGCENSTVAPNFTISAGAIFFNGEIYLVDAVTFTAGGGQTAVGTITETYFNDATADPVTFTDGVARDVHLIRKIVFASAVAGSGDVNFADLLPLEEAADPWHEVGAVGEPAFQSGWSNAGFSSVLRFKKYSDNTLAIVGILDVTTVGTAPDMYRVFQLPVGWRPTNSVSFFVNCNGTGVLPAAVDISDNMVRIVVPSTGTFNDIVLITRIALD